MGFMYIAKPLMVKTQQPVEKPCSVTLMAAWMGLRDLESPFLEPNWGSRAGVREFFNRLASLATGRCTNERSAASRAALSVAPRSPSSPPEYDGLRGAGKEHQI